MIKRYGPRRPLTDEDLERLKRLAELPDEDIDLSDIPELTAEQWAEAFRPVRVMLDAKLIDWFKANSGDVAYQVQINHVLRQHVAKAEKKRA